jgi:hypothetical protein
MIASSSRTTRKPGKEVSANQRQAFAGKVVDDRENAEAPTIDEGIRRKVEAPAPVRSLRDR